MNKDEFESTKQDVYTKWVSLGYQVFKDYFDNEWVTGQFNKWQSYHTPPGFANTNNPVEQLNSKIKQSLKKLEDK
jgi:hypothetical protein